MASLAAALLLSACGPLPSSGPRHAEFQAGAAVTLGDPGPVDAPALPYALITLDPNVVRAVAMTAPAPSFPSLRRGRGPLGVIGPGDVLAVTIFETQAGGLFLPAEAGTRPGNFVTLPPQQVDRLGNISIPFAGAVRAAGRTPAEIEQVVQRRLASRALDPQVVVSLQDRRASHISVVGDVNVSTRFPLDAAGERLLGALARAGGPRFPAYETRVTVQRAGQTETAFLSDMIADPSQNIPLEDGDTVVVNREPRFFSALGAVGQTASITQLNRRFPFDDRRITLAEAVARAGGLQDDRANASAVFLFRMERPVVVTSLGLPPPPVPTAPVPVVYRADFGLPSTMFLANQFQLQHEDIIFVSTAPLVDYEKFIRYLLPFTQSAVNAAAIQR